MPGLLVNGGATAKRKRDDARDVKPRKAPKTTANGESAQARILLLEEQTLESREHYNNIVKLQQLVGNFEQKPKPATLAAVALCRVFCRLIAGEKLIRRNEDTDAEAQVAQWLKARLKAYVDALTSWLGGSDATQESTALTLLMRIVKEEVSTGSRRSEQAWRTEKSTFYLLVSALLEREGAEAARQEFVEKFVEEHDDVRFYTLLAVKNFFHDEKRQQDVYLTNAIDLLSQIEGVPESEDQLEDWYGDTPPKPHQLHSLNAHRKTAQEAWLTIFRSPLTPTHRKAILTTATSHILPWFTTRMELLTDFLTDSFAQGGTLSLLSLSSIFHLMTAKSLDYPDFYTKLYSLLDAEVLHSKHRSRFFRLLDQFLSSSHLPAALVASFVKRFARLALQAPPGAVVWIVTWTYDVMKQHPACTFMLHRPYHPSHAIYSSTTKAEDDTVQDPFNPTQPDPMHTNAIDSSLWELGTLQSHYHPNVATLARILGEQFTKREYVLEDFLDHSYASLVDAELGKAVKKTPVVEWEIPKRIFTTEDSGLNAMGKLLQSAIERA